MAGMPRRVARRIRRTALTKRGRAVRAARRNRSGSAPATGPNAGSAPVSNAMVEVLERRQIVGWVEVPQGAPPTRVGLYINDTQVVGVWAVDPAGRRGTGEVRQFRFPLFDLWRFAKTTDRISVRIDGRLLPINGRGTFYHPRNDGRSDLAELGRLQNDGYVFSDAGKLQLSKTIDTGWQNTVTGLYTDMRAELREQFGIEPFFIYGTLLGAVRENGFIGHDHDFDSAFLSTETDPRAAARQLQEIAFMLIDRGFRVRGQYSAIHVFDKQTNKTRIDLFHLYFDEDGVLQFPFGVAGKDDIKKSDWKGLREIEFGGGHGLVPVNAEAMVAHIYGQSWRTPNPGFNWTRDRSRRAAAGLLKAPQIEEIYWSNFYAHTQFQNGSSFFELVDARADLPHTVIDLGCGEGRDSFAFAKAGRRVTGVDRSEVGVVHATKKAHELGYAETLRFAACDVADAVALRDTLTAARDADRPMLFYARFFLHSIPEDVQQTLMSVIAECARPGDYFAAEFRTDKDEASVKVHGEHYRRFQKGAAFGQQLTETFGFTKLLEQEGNGFSPYKDEDPQLYRVVARRTVDESSA